MTGSIDDAHLYWGNDHRPLLREAAEYVKGRRYRCNQPHVIARDVHAAPPGPPPLLTRAAGPLELRSAPTLDVVERSRTVTVLAAPVGEEATVVIRGRVVGETFGVGCFAGDEHRAHRVKALREHNPERVVGRALEIDPYSKLGCVATLKISRTLLGDETLALCEDRVLDCSVGFRIRPGGERWNATRSSREVTGGELDHIGLVVSPAYSGANILDVGSY